MSSLRWRASLAGAAVLAAVVPAVASAVSPQLGCRTATTVGSWQTVTVNPFHQVPGVDTVDKVTAYAVDAKHPGTVVATNGTTLKRSLHSGCDWVDAFQLGLQPTADVPLSGQVARIVSTTLLPSGRVLAAVREGAGAASRPHVVGSDDGRPGSYRTADTGLPPQGAPKLLKAASDGRTVYLVLTPVGSTDTGPVDPSGLPSLPPVDTPTTSGGKAGLLYASTDGGHSWALRTSASDLPAGAGLDQLAIDRRDPNLLYATSNGLLYLSRDGGASFARARVNNEDVTAVETMAPGQVAFFTRGGFAVKSTDGGHNFFGGRSIAGVTSAAYRAGDSRLAVEANGQLSLVDPATGRSFFAPGPTAARGSLTGDVGSQATFHGLAGHALLRYIDPPPAVQTDIPVSVDDIGVPPPPPGIISPGARTVQLKVGTSGVYDYTLAMPKSPTPLDLFFLIDTSGSMLDYIDNLKTNISKVTNAIQKAGINLQVGVGTLGTGPRPGEVVPPYVNPSDPNDRGSTLYSLFRRIGPVDKGFAAALKSVTVKNQAGNNPAEAQLAALEQATFGPGIKDPRSTNAAPLFIVQPGQDAGWRAAPGIRRIIVHATDEAFDKPAGSPVKPNGELDFAKVIREMNAYRVQQIGITTGAIESRDDLSTIARGTHTLAPQGGSNCGEGVILPARSPLVCDTEGDFSALIGHLVSSLQDHADVTLSARGSTPKVIRALDALQLQGIDVTHPNTLPFRVAVTCKGQSPGTYTEDIAASLRGVRIATSHLTVQCLGPAAALRLLPPAVAALPAVPPPPAPVAVVPAPPAAQPQAAPQAQPNAQAQVQPLTAAAMQQQEELQLALALQAGVEERPAADEELAMVNRRRTDESAAFALLAAAMLASSAVGLARLRSRPEPAVVRARR